MTRRVASVYTLADEALEVPKRRLVDSRILAGGPQPGLVPVDATLRPALGVCAAIAAQVVQQDRVAQLANPRIVDGVAGSPNLAINDEGPPEEPQHLRHERHPCKAPRIVEGGKDLLRRTKRNAVAGPHAVESWTQCAFPAAFAMQPQVT